MFQHRAALAAFLVAVVASLSLYSSQAAAAPTPSSPIASVAESYNGTWQGECWAFVKKVVREATGNEMGFDYRQGYFDAGATEVSVADARAGDIIQIANDANSGPDADYSGLHSSIILQNLGDGLFDVIDSNQNYDGMVAHRAGYNPAAAAARYGINFHIYRIPVDPTAGRLAPPIGTARSAGPSAPLPDQVLVAGDSALVYTPGDILNLRTGAGRDYSVKATLAHGTAVAVLLGPVSTDGISWVKVHTPSGDGWVAAQYLTKDSSKPATPSSAGPASPILRFRAFVPFATLD